MIVDVVYLFVLVVYFGFIPAVRTHATYSIHPKKSVRLAFKFCPQSAILACSEIHLIKALSDTKKKLYRKAHGANQILSDATFFFPMHMHLLRI